jgi:alkanesulfonate monooxygenase SsuD/methylene tetrahydromethanopterin reductase-like flavin-dependent oxidoreductase (luciferase family)
VWSGGRGVRFDGRFYQLAGLNAGPVPAHAIGIWLGAYKPRMLRLVGKAADGWVPSYGHLKQETMPDANARIDDAAREGGRDPAVIRRVLNVAANLTADEIAELALEHGFDTFVIGETQEDVEAELREFLENVAPKVRELVVAGRA